MLTTQPPVPSDASPLRQLDFEFNGTAREYFGIWIINILLTIVTIGIYSAWAKVRRLRYFYGNTYLDGHNFEYLAKPKQILIGRIIVVGFFLIINILVTISPLFSVIWILVLFIVPWAINGAMSFSARMTSYRNIRFGFKGSYWRAFWLFIIFPMIAILSVGLLAPLLSRAIRNYIGNGLFYGAAPFRTDLQAGPLYANLGWTVLFWLATAPLGTFALFLPFAPRSEDVASISPWIIAAMIFAYLMFFLAIIFYRAGVRNAAYAATTLEGGHRFRSTLGRLRMVWIVVSNLFVTVATLGLMRPWAAIRSWSYMTSRTAVLAAGPLDDFVGKIEPRGNVGAAEYVEFAGIDLGL